MLDIQTLSFNPTLYILHVNVLGNKVKNKKLLGNQDVENRFLSHV